MRRPTCAPCSFALAAALSVTLASPPAAAQDALSAVRSEVQAGRYLRQGARGAAVRALQRELSQLGLPLQADGVFGPLTAGAVRAFQRRAGLSADGVVGPRTLRALEETLGDAPPARTPPARTPPATDRGERRGLADALLGDGGSSVDAAARDGAGGAAPSRDGVGGAALFADARALTGARREAHFWEQIQQGAVPSFVTEFQKVTLRGRDTTGRERTLEVWVSPDYLALGTDADFVRVPLTPATAQRVCDRYGCLLPTRKLVDAIYAQAAVRLTPQPLPPGPEMTTTPIFERHHRRIEDQLWSVGSPPLRALKAGHKKDLVITPRLESRRGRVAIYGWHQRNGRPIQPLSTVHGASYVDYSHGVRLVRDEVRLDGRRASAAELLKDPVLHPLLSDEGRFSSARAD